VIPQEYNSSNNGEDIPITREIYVPDWVDPETVSYLQLGIARKKEPTS